MPSNTNVGQAGKRSDSNDRSGRPVSKDAKGPNVPKNPSARTSSTNATGRSSSTHSQGSVNTAGPSGPSVEAKAMHTKEIADQDKEEKKIKEDPAKAPGARVRRMVTDTKNGRIAAPSVGDIVASKADDLDLISAIEMAAIFIVSGTENSGALPRTSSYIGAPMAQILFNKWCGHLYKGKARDDLLDMETPELLTLLSRGLSDIERFMDIGDGSGRVKPGVK